MNIWDMIINLTPALWLPFAWYSRSLNKYSIDISTLTPRTPNQWPMVSIVVAACNEEETIQAGLQSLLSIDYPNLEIIVVNDRSTDKTKEIIEQSTDARLKVVHIETLPEGWLGKVHALHIGTQQAKGEWVLYTDADIHFSPNAVKKTIAACLEKNIDHLTLLPRMYSESFWAQSCISITLCFIAISQKPWHVSNPNRKEAVGAGAFNLVRKEAFLNTAGFEWLRMEVADDIGLGLMMKESGATSHFYTAFDDVHVEWYPSLWSAVRGLEKNAYSQIARFSLLRGLFFSAAAATLGLTPFLSMFGSFSPWSTALCAFIAIYTAYKIYPISKISKITLSMSFIVGNLLLCYIGLRSTILGTLRGGVIWRGTVYPNEELRKGMRVLF